ncbi:MAG: PAS domain-containing protein [Proteobacteria bacterium]|nr:PAS domain-containing protein [Pseudomonadota bacterium]
MLLKNKYQLFALISFVILSIIAAVIYYQFWLNLSPEEQTVLGKIFKDNIGPIFIAFVLIVFAFGLAFDQFLNTYVLPLKRTVEELSIVTSVNSSHRISLEGSTELESLVDMINKMADRIELSEQEIEKTIQQAKRESEEEKNRLAAVISGFPEGIIICNINWQILLYNQKARSLLADQSDDQQGNRIPSDSLGLGRSILGILNKKQVVHVFDELTNRLEKEEDQSGYHFAHTTNGGGMLDIHAIPIIADDIEIFGFVLIVKDITQRMVVEDQREVYLDSLITSIRSAMSGIRAAMETIIDFPDMGADELTKLRRIILDETHNLSSVIDCPEVESILGSKSEWPMEDFQCDELLEIIRKKAQSDLALSIEVQSGDENLWIHVDSFSIVHAVLFQLHKLVLKNEPEWIQCRFKQSGKSVMFDLAWQGASISPQDLNQWVFQRMEIGEASIPLTLKETMRQHNTEIWPQVTSDGYPCLRMMFPKVTSKLVTNDRPHTAISVKSRTEFYDFDIFNQVEILDFEEDRLLSELTYTVFDTETTGLNPKEDEIISIGALRIVNGRLLREESFDRLIDPHRSIPKESIKYHGIKADMLKGQPDIKVILPNFYNFARDTVLIGHNAAFDMKMLQMKERSTGISFTNPVLDTLLLSAVINPAQKKHHLEAIAKRLGIRVIGRHTALGDALTTGELFLKMIPLLETKNIFTLKQAIEASRKTYYARLKY